jgi:hypothetical protein
MSIGAVEIMLIGFVALVLGAIALRNRRGK